MCREFNSPPDHSTKTRVSLAFARGYAGFVVLAAAADDAARCQGMGAAAPSGRLQRIAAQPFRIMTSAPFWRRIHEDGPVVRNFSITLGWSPAFRRFWAENRLKAGLQPGATQSY